MPDSEAGVELETELAPELVPKPVRLLMLLYPFFSSHRGRPGLSGRVLVLVAVGSLRLSLSFPTQRLPFVCRRKLPHLGGSP